jgi:hypothetical protein
MHHFCATFEVLINFRDGLAAYMASGLVRALSRDSRSRRQCSGSTPASLGASPGATEKEGQSCERQHPCGHGKASCTTKTTALVIGFLADLLAFRIKSRWCPNCGATTVA